MIRKKICGLDLIVVVLISPKNFNDLFSKLWKPRGIGHLKNLKYVFVKIGENCDGDGGGVILYYHLDFAT